MYESLWHEIGLIGKKYIGSANLFYRDVAPMHLTHAHSIPKTNENDLYIGHGFWNERVISGCEYDKAIFESVLIQ